MQGITGKLSGKMGSAVFRVRDGQQVVAQYNPIVKNPNSEGQQAQRAKFKLMSQLAAIMSPGFGTMSVSKHRAKGKPSQRNAFTQLNFPLVTVETDNQEVTASIPMADLKLTSSFRPLGVMSLSATSSTAFDADIDQVPADVASVRFLLVRYPLIGGSRQAQLSEILDVPVSEGSVSHSFTGMASGEKVTVLAYGLIPSETAKASISLDNIHTPADDDFISAVKLNEMVANGEIAETSTIGANLEVTA